MAERTRPKVALSTMLERGKAAGQLGSLSKLAHQFRPFKASFRSDSGKYAWFVRSELRGVDCGKD